MTNKEFYQKTFSQVRPSRDLKWEDFRKMKRKNSVVRRLTVLAAVIGILAALSAAAVAADWFGLRSVLLPERGRVSVTDERGVVVPGEYEERDFYQPLRPSGHPREPGSGGVAGIFGQL